MVKRHTDESFFDTLTRLLSTEGCSSLTIGEMAQRLRCSRRRLYELAPSKEELFARVCQGVLAESIEKGHAAARQARDPAQAVAAYLHAALNASGLSKAALIDLDSTGMGRAVFDAYQLARMRGLEALLQQAIDHGQMVAHNPRLVSEALLGSAQRLRNPCFLDDMGMRIGDAFAEFYEIVLNGLLRRPAAQTAKRRVRAKSL